MLLPALMLVGCLNTQGYHSLGTYQCEPLRPSSKEDGFLIIRSLTANESSFIQSKSLGPVVQN